MVDLRCPQCHRLDQVRKVSALIAGDTTTGQYSGQTSVPLVATGTTRMQGTTQSLLSQRLQPPQRPQFGADETEAVLWFVAAGIGVLGALFIFTNGINMYLWLFGVIEIWLIERAIRRRISSKEIYNSEIIPDWELVMEDWNNSYYCGRCDKVFVAR